MKSKHVQLCTCFHFMYEHSILVGPYRSKQVARGAYYLDTNPHAVRPNAGSYGTGSSSTL